jgi:glycosyltransferase involved in cell wall biosynthesis
MRPLRSPINPYSTFLGAALADEGLTVSHIGYGPGSYDWLADVILLHWPDEFFIRMHAKRRIKGYLLLAMILLGKLRRQKLIWVVHNVVPHDRNAAKTRLSRPLFFSQLDGLIFLSRASRELAISIYPELEPLPSVVVPHGAYLPAKDRPPTLATRPIEPPARIAFIGRIERYKAPELLAQIISAMPKSRIRLHMAGACEEKELASELTHLAGPNVTLDLAYQSDEALERLVDESDAVALPYRDIVNSGSVLYALSRNRPVLAPAVGSLVELRDQVGSEWLFLYEGDLTRATVERFLDWLASCPRQAPPDLREHGWPSIANKAAEFLRGIADRSLSPRTTLGFGVASGQGQERSNGSSL